MIIDIGTGDGLFVYQSARQNPNKFYIGIDATVRQLEKVSEKIYRKPSKGGAANVIFVQSSVEDLPSELDGVAGRVHIHFPWGSLLKAVAVPSLDVLRTIRRLCATDALLKVVMSLDTVRDASEISRHGLQPLSIEWIDQILRPAYQAAGFEIVERSISSLSNWPDLKSSWAKRLRVGGSRKITYVVAKSI